MGVKTKKPTEQFIETNHVGPPFWLGGTHRGHRMFTPPKSEKRGQKHPTKGREGGGKGQLRQKNKPKKGEKKGVAPTNSGELGGR